MVQDRDPQAHAATLLQTKIVRTAADTLAPIHSPDGSHNIWFPSNPQRDAARIWRCCRTGFPTQLPAKADIGHVERHHLARMQQAHARPSRRFHRANEQSKNLQSELRRKRTSTSGSKSSMRPRSSVTTSSFQWSPNARIFPNQNGTFKKEGRTHPRRWRHRHRDTRHPQTPRRPTSATTFSTRRSTRSLDDLAQKDGGFVVK